MEWPTFPSEAFDRWKVAQLADEEWAQRPTQPHEPCAECGHKFRDHYGRAQECWKCAKEDSVCAGFKLDEDALDRDRASIEADRLVDSEREETDAR